MKVNTLSILLATLAVGSAVTIPIDSPSQPETPSRSRLSGNTQSSHSLGRRSLPTFKEDGSRSSSILTKEVSSDAPIGSAMNHLVPRTFVSGRIEANNNLKTSQSLIAKHKEHRANLRLYEQGATSKARKTKYKTEIAQLEKAKKATREKLKSRLEASDRRAQVYKEEKAKYKTTDPGKYRSFKTQRKLAKEESRIIRGHLEATQSEETTAPASEDIPPVPASGKESPIRPTEIESPPE